MLPYKTRRSVYAICCALFSGFYFWSSWHWMSSSRDLGMANMVLAFAQIIMSCIIWKRRNRPPPTV